MSIVGSAPGSRAEENRPHLTEANTPRHDEAAPAPRAEAVRHRHVFFLAGFDPKSARYYHALYRSQARRQAAVSGLQIDIGKARSRPSPHSTAWQLHVSTPQGAVETTFELLQWDDIVRAHWSSSAWRVLADGIRTVTFGLRDGAVQRMYRLFRPPVYAVFFPLVLLTACAGLALLLAWGVSAGVATSTDLPRGLAHATGAAAALLLLWQTLRQVHRLQMTWLLRLVRFTHLHATGKVPGIEQRLAAFTDRIAAVLDDPDCQDEVLVVGHSVGATLALPVLAGVLERQRHRWGHNKTPDGPYLGRPTLTLLSLGHCIPLMSALSAAKTLRRDLQTVAHSAIDWLDVSAPIDWAAFPGIDPVTGADLAPAPPGWHPRLLSPRFHQLFSPAAYARLKRNRFQVHLQYLMASERPGPYDYFAITAGPQRLRERFADAAEAIGSAPSAEQSPE